MVVAVVLHLCVRRPSLCRLRLQPDSTLSHTEPLAKHGQNHTNTHTHTHTPRKPGNALMRGHTDDHSPAPRSPDVTKTPCFKRLLLQGRGGRGGGERKKEKKKRKESSGFQQRGGEGFFFSVLQIWFYLAEPWNTFQKLQTYFFGAVFGEDS